MQDVSFENELFLAAVQLADLAAEISRKYFRSELEVDLKTGNYPVTNVDREIEQCLRAWIKDNYPEHGIIGEEFANQDSHKSRYTWVIDPIDGTAAYTTGKPLFTTLVAVLEDDKPLIGVIDQPICNDRFTAIAKQGARLNGHIVYSQKTCNKLAGAKLNATTPYMFKTLQEKSAFEKLHNVVQQTTFGGDAYAYGLLATGYIDIIMEADLGYYDVAALIPIVVEAGGVITDWQGHEIIMPNFAGQCLASGNRELHQLALAIINE